MRSLLMDVDRWIHLPSGRVYNLGYNKPMVPGLDDITREPLSKRPDDRPVRARSFTKQAISHNK